MKHDVDRDLTEMRMMFAGIIARIGALWLRERARAGESKRGWR